MNFISALIVAASAFVGGVLQATTALGSGMVMMAVLPSVLGSVLAVSVLGNISSTGCALTALLQTWRSTKVKTVSMLLPMYFVFMPLGNMLIIRISNTAAKRVLGVVIILFACYNLFVHEFRFKPALWKALIAGALSGLLGGMFALAGPPIAVYVLNDTDDKNSYIATTHAFFLVSCLYATVIRILSGVVTAQLWFAALVAFVGISAGTLAGSLLRRRINMDQMKHWIYVFFIVIGAVFFFGT